MDYSTLFGLPLASYPWDNLEFVIRQSKPRAALPVVFVPPQFATKAKASGHLTPTPTRADNLKHAFRGLLFERAMASCLTRSRCSERRSGKGMNPTMAAILAHFS
jgi:hypothetical protein